MDMDSKEYKEFLDQEKAKMRSKVDEQVQQFSESLIKGAASFDPGMSNV